LHFTCVCESNQTGTSCGRAGPVEHVFCGVFLRPHALTQCSLPTHMQCSSGLCSQCARTHVQRRFGKPSRANQHRCVICGHALAWGGCSAHTQHGIAHRRRSPPNSAGSTKLHATSHHIVTCMPAGTMSKPQGLRPPYTVGARQIVPDPPYCNFSPPPRLLTLLVRPLYIDE
jgi:hypothetical protein